MIPLNELRIGNWVILKEDGLFMQMEVTSFLLLEGDLEPIPLTPERLEEFGFESYSNPNNTPSVIYSLDSFKLVISNLRESDTIYYLREYYYAKGIKYLHELQNLYFALRGEELEVQL